MTFELICWMITSVTMTIYQSISLQDWSSLDAAWSSADLLWQLVMVLVGLAPWHGNNVHTSNLYRSHDSICMYTLTIQNTWSSTYVRSHDLVHNKYVCWPEEIQHDLSVITSCYIATLQCLIQKSSVIVQLDSLDNFIKLCMIWLF